METGKIIKHDYNLQFHNHLIGVSALLLNSRFLFSLISQAELSAEIGYYEQAIVLFDNITVLSVNDSILSFKVKNYIFWQCFCIIALDDWVRLEKKFKQFIEQYPSFAD